MENKLKKIKRKVLITTVLFFLAVLLFRVARPTFAATTYGNFLNYFSGLTQEGLGFNNLSNTVFGLLTGLVGTPSSGGDVTSYKQQPGAIQVIANLTGSIYSTPPASGVYYAYDLLHRFGAVPAYAQGVGFTNLQPILPAWKAFRNLTYILFTLIFLVIGVMIMLRVKISPQAVITVENALPKILGAMILVTFSYAIAGLMIDLMYVVMALGINILKSAGIDVINLLGISLVPGPETVIKAGFLALISPFLVASFNASIVGAVLGGMLGTLGGVSGAIAGSFIAPVVGTAVGAVAGTVVGTITGITLGGAIVGLVMAIVTTFLLFKLFFGLITAYIKIIVAIIFSPLQIMAGAIPSSQGGFSSWIKGLVAELMIFPVVMIMAIIGLFIMSSAGGPMWMAPLLTLDIAGIGASHITSFNTTIIGLGFLLVIANVPNMVRQAFGIKDSGMFGAAFAPVGMAAGVLSWLPRQAGQIAWGGASKAGSQMVGDLAREEIVGIAQKNPQSWLGKRIIKISTRNQKTQSPNP